MTLSRIIVSVPWLLFAVGACFVEPPDVGGPGTTTATQECTAGALGCACYGNATCDAGLECAAGPGLCVPSGCEPGEAACTCDHDSCAPPLVCIEDLCAAPQTGSSGDDSSGGASTEGDGTTAGPGGTTEASTVADSSGGDVTDGSSSGDAPTCDDVACGECPSCATEPGGICEDEAAACDDIEGCPAAAACLASCGTSGLCIDPCCLGLDGSATAAAVAVNACRRDACALSCPDYNLGTCG